MWPSHVPCGDHLLNVKDVSSHLDKKLPRAVLFVSLKKPGPLGNDPGKQQAGNENETNTVYHGQP